MKRPILLPALSLALMTLTSACVIHERRDDASSREEGYREGYYDREHHRYYRDHSWHECMEHDDYCRQ